MNYTTYRSRLAAGLTATLFIVFIIVSYGAHASAAASGKFDSKAWLDAPKKNPRNWSRDIQLTLFCTGHPMSTLDRKKVHEMLGPPAISAEIQPGSQYAQIMDCWQLSAKNETHFRIDYDTKGKLTSWAREQGPCGTGFVLEPAPSSECLPEKKLQSALQLLASSPVITSADLERLTGKPTTRRTDQSTIGGRPYEHESSLYRLSTDGRRVLKVDWSCPLADRSNVKMSYSICTMSAP